MSKCIMLSTFKGDNMKQVCEEIKRMSNNESPVVLYIDTRKDTFEEMVEKEINIKRKYKEYGNIEKVFYINILAFSAIHSFAPYKMFAMADIIHFGGGNTYDLMKDIRDCGLDVLIKQASDKVYVGTSAGAIIMAPQIDLASDEKHGMTDFKGLGLVNFYLKPHWNRYTEEEQINFLEYGARVYGTTHYHIDDGEALIIDSGIPNYISLKG